MIILDTNVLSALMLKRPPGVVMSWLDTQPPESIWTTFITVFDVRFGLEILEDGRRRTRLTKAFEDLLVEELSGRVLDFDRLAATAAAAIARDRRRQGRPLGVRDAMIAGIVRTRHAMLSTRNVRHFAEIGIALVNPWDPTTDA